MGAEERQPLPDLKGGALAPFERDARRYSFFRLIYLLERLAAGSPPVGQLGPVSDERIRLRGDTSLVFASSDVSSVEAHKGSDGTTRARVSSAFMALYGSVSPLPTYFVEQLALTDYQGGPQPIREFLDVFHHRLLSLVYRAWTKYRFSVMYRRQGKDSFSRRMFCSVGLDGFKDTEAQPGVMDRFMFLRYAPILASKSRSARGLDVVLNDLFGSMGVKLEQFVGHWTRIEKPYRNKIGVMNHQLGESLTIGRYVYDGSGRFTIVLGPLGYDEYLSFLPGGHRRPMLRGVVDSFTRGMYDVMLELHVQTEAAPRFQLGSPRAATLKRTAWLGGTGGGEFVITVPLAEQPPGTGGGSEDDDDDRGEPPPL
jgi:type VI secretion system protein ImpH